MFNDQDNLRELCLTWQRQMRQAAARGAAQERVQYSACPETGAPRACAPACARPLHANGVLQLMKHTHAHNTNLC